LAPLIRYRRPGPVLTEANRRETAFEGKHFMHVIARPAFKDAVKTPYTYFLYSFMKQLGVAVSEYSTRDVMLRRPDILHIHWPDSLLELQTAKRAMISARKFYTILFLARKRGVKLIWTVHDLVPHDFIYPEIERPFWNWTINQMDGIIALTTKGLLMAQERYPSLRATPSFVIPHGHFRDAYPRIISREHARSSLGIAPTRRMITYFGHIRPYKNIPQLIRAFRAMDDQEAALFICGRVGNRVNCEDEIRREAEGYPRVHLVLRYIEPSEIQVYLAAADILAFPYSDILNSGSAILALSHDRPILVPNLGALPELRAAVGEEWVCTYEGEISAEILRNALKWARTTRRHPRAKLDHLNWNQIAEQTLAAYKSVLNH
jgi:beta-1,4-mannosyltransferase